MPTLLVNVLAELSAASHHNSLIKVCLLIFNLRFRYLILGLLYMS